MNILAITKFPPIQGGESNKAFYLFNELANRGHKVFVLTNTDDVKEENKSYFTEEDYKYLSANDNLKIFNVGVENLPRFIPQFDPKTEKLLNIGLSIITENKIDLIYGWYFLPYVSAAYLLSKITSIPFVLQHAGSDLKRILPTTAFNNYFNQIIDESAGILTYHSSASYFPKKETTSLLLQKPNLPNIYTPFGAKADFNKQYNINRNPDSVFACFGKFSNAKGFYETIDAFKSVKESTLLIFSPNKESMNLELPDNVFLLKSVAPWKIPEIIRALKAVIVPEWDFGVEIHRSRLPIESVLCGKPALVSKQIVDGYSLLKYFMIPIETPNRESMISRIQYITQNTSIEENLLKQNSSLKTMLPTFEEYVNEVDRKSVV